ncbi:MAG: hypothetical protein DDG59_01825, partial [Anaerolineae bacterium]
MASYKPKFAQEVFSKALFFGAFLLGMSLGYKPLLALVYQQRAGQALAQVLPVGNNEYGGFACLQPFVEEYQQRQSLINALGYLRKAQAYSPSQSHVDYLLGRTFCLLGDYENAIAS